MMENEIKINHYYLVDISWWFDEWEDGRDKLAIGKFIGRNQTIYQFTFEFLKNIKGHSGMRKGKLGYCLFVKDDDILCEATPDDIMVYML
jgi:hypothetical protein